MATTTRTHAPLLPSIVLGLAGVLGALAGPPAVNGHGEMVRGPLPAEMRGTYRLANGEILTFTGQHGMPSYELAGRRAYVHPDGEDRFAAWDDPDEALVIERDAAGEVSGVSLVHAGAIVARGAKADLYTEHDVTFANGDVTLAGSVLLPPGAGPHPGVVITHGAEAATRESYRLLASHFARRGVSALIYDKRGLGDSGGSFRGATFDDLAGDALAGLRLLSALPTVDAERVGLQGTSQGAWVIALAALASDEVAFLIPVSASGFSPAVQDRWLNGNIIAHRQLGAAINGASERAWRMLLSTRDLIEAGWMAPMPDVPGFWFHALDPNLDTDALWQQVRQPLLGVWGELDCQLPAYDSAAAVRASLDRGGHANYTLVILPGADHSITLVGPCAQETTGWSVLRHDYPESYFGLLADWVHRHDAAELPVREVVVPDEPLPTTLAWYQAPSAGAGVLGSFVPQVVVILALLAAFTARIGGGLAGSLSCLARRQRPQFTLGGGAAALGLLATLLAVAALVELLLLGSNDNIRPIGGAPVLGLTPLYLLASVTTLATLGVGSLSFARAPAGRSAGAWLGLTVLIVFAAWSAYWAFLPSWLIAGFA